MTTHPKEDKADRQLPVTPESTQPADKDIKVETVPVDTGTEDETAELIDEHEVEKIAARKNRSALRGVEFQEVKNPVSTTKEDEVGDKFMSDKDQLATNRNYVETKHPEGYFPPVYEQPGV